MEFSKAVREVWVRDPDGGAIEFEGTWFSWRGISNAARGIDEAFERAGISQEAAIGLIARNRVGPAAALVALLGLRRCVVMIYAAQTPEAIARDIASLRLAAIVGDERDWDHHTISAAHEIGTLGLVARGDPSYPIAPVPELQQLRATDYRLSPPDVALELLSSGTTGAPKRIPLRISTFEQAAVDAGKIYVAASDRPPTSVVFHPISNIAGLTFFIPLMFFGQPVCLIERFDLEVWLDAVERHRPARASLPPAVLKQMLEVNVPAEALNSFDVIGVGAAALDPELQEQFEARYEVPLLISYGATEFGGVVANWTSELHTEFAQTKRGSVGRARPGCALRIVDPTTGIELAIGEPGLLEVQAERLGPEWIRTTDLASIDPDGFLFLLGRADAAINRGGFKVVPDKVAAALRRHPAVRDAAVVGVLDERLGEIPVAAIELVAGAVVGEDELRMHAGAELLRYEVPASFHIVESLPRNASMKVDLTAVRRHVV